MCQKNFVSTRWGKISYRSCLNGSSSPKISWMSRFETFFSPLAPLTWQNIIFFWDYWKSKVYQHKLPTLDELKVKIIRVMREVPWKILIDKMGLFREHLDSWIAVQGRIMTDIIFRTLIMLRIKTANFSAFFGIINIFPNAITFGIALFWKKFVYFNGPCIKLQFNNKCVCTLGNHNTVGRKKKIKKYNNNW